MQVFERSSPSRKSLSVSDVEHERTELIEEKLIGVSAWAQSARKAVAAHSAHDRTVIIEGEPGTGKEFLAHLIHECSARHHGPFLAISFESVSEESALAVLFGRGSARSANCYPIPNSLIKAADGGTLYINGILGLSDTIKARLGRLMEHGEFCSDEDNSTEYADVRIILGASDRPCSEDQSELSIDDHMSAPPLGARREDVEPLVRHFVKQTCQRLGKEPRRVCAETISALRDYDWPGNIAELKGVIWEVILKSEPPPIEHSLLPASITAAQSSTSNLIISNSIPAAGINLADEIERIEKSLLCVALKQSHGVQNRAAQLLGLKPTTLNMKLSRYGIDVKANR
jgi:DNA-binding NtrC family response regulator